MSQPSPSDLARQLDECQRRAANLEIALVNARRIGAAIGILMAKRTLTYDEAFQLLVHASQVLRRKLSAIADDVIFSGAMPDLPKHEGGG